MKKKKKKEQTAETHPELQGFDIRVNPFGEIVTNISIDRIIDFLDKHVVDKKLNEEEWEEKKTGKSTNSPSGKSKKKK